MSINCSGFYLVRQANGNGQMHVNLIISVPAIKIITSTILLPCTDSNHCNSHGDLICRLTELEIAVGHWPFSDQFSPFDKVSPIC